MRTTIRHLVPLLLLHLVVAHLLRLHLLHFPTSTMSLPHLLHLVVHRHPLRAQEATWTPSSPS